MAKKKKKKALAPTAVSDGDERPRVALTSVLPEPPADVVEALVPDERPTFESLRASVGRGTLAEQVLQSIEGVLTELERLYGEVAALGKSLALARDQLAEQEAELDAVNEAR